MAAKQNISKVFSFPYFTNRCKTNGSENNMEIIKQFDIVQMIPYDSLALNAGCEKGTLCVVKHKNVDRYHLSFYTSVDKKAEWDIILDTHSQIKKPLPNMLSILSYGTTTLFRFSDAAEAETFYSFIENIQGNMKLVIRSDFYPLDSDSVNVARSTKVQVQLKERYMNHQPKFVIKSVEPKKPKKNSKQKLITNSFRTIVSAAKTVKQKKKKHTDLKKKLKDDNNDDDRSPLLL